MRSTNISAKGFSFVEILLGMVVMLAIAYIFLKQQKQEPANFAKAMKDAGVEVSPEVKKAEDLTKAVEAQLNATVEQRQKTLNKAVDANAADSN